MNGQNAPANSYQRLAIRFALERLELPLDRVTVMHRDLFTKSGIGWREGAQLDAVLSEITQAQASALINKLKERSR